MKFKRILTWIVVSFFAMRGAWVEGSVLAGDIGAVGFAIVVGGLALIQLLDVVFEDAT